MSKATVIDLPQEKKEEVNDIPSFPDLYQEYGKVVRSVIYKISGEGDLDDLVQEAFVKIWNGLEKFRGSSSLKTWVYRISTNLALDHLRKKKRRFPLDLYGRAEIPSDSQDQKLIYQDLVRKGLKSLSTKHRTVLVLHMMEGIPLNQVAEVLGISKGTAKSRLFYAKKDMLSFLESNGVKL